MRSTRGLAGSAILLAGVPVAFAIGIAFGSGAEAAIHIALAASFLLIAIAVFDFGLPTRLRLVASMGIAALAIVFLLQAASDITGFAPLTHIAFDVLGQYLEKVLGYVFLLWCAAVVLIVARGGTRLVGIAALAIVLVVEVYSAAMTMRGDEPSGILKLFYLPVFIWLLLESLKPRVAAASGS